MVPKNARRPSGFEAQALALQAGGMTVRDMRSHLAKMYGTDVSPDLISKVTDAVNDEITAWHSQPFDSLWPVACTDELWIKARGARRGGQGRQPAGAPRRRRRSRRLQRDSDTSAPFSIRRSEESRRSYDRKRAEGQRHTHAVLALAPRRRRPSRFDRWHEESWVRVPSSLMPHNREAEKSERFTPLRWRGCG
ncbi:transposase [Streptomyces sp. IBSNAI002]|uniref:transposase n=1 Tax=Streptomyces sp. IBSNAI002 TaxID=3457500 RepID=UPI003FD52BDE